jgi:DNA-binding NtrC family response regulator
VSCAAQGNKHCRVIGKPAEVWGEDDPEVRFFRSQVVPAARDEAAARPVRGRTAAAAPDLEQLLLAPVLGLLDRLAAARLPVLLCGPAGAGAEEAATYLGRTGGGTVERLACDGLSVEALERALAPGAKSAGRRVLLLRDLDEVAAPAQQRLAAALGDPGQGPLLAATLADLPERVPGFHALRPDLWLRFAVSPVVLPPLADRRDEIGAIAAALLARLAPGLGAGRFGLTPEASAWLAGRDWPGGMVELGALLTAAVLEAPGGASLGVEALMALAGRFGALADTAAPGVEGWLAEALAGPGLRLEALEARIYRAALERAGGNVSAAARLLGLTRPQLAYRLQKAG